MKVLILAAHDLKLVLRDRSSLFWMFIAPLLWVGLFGRLAGGGDGSQTRISLEVRVEAESPAAEKLLELLEVENFAVTIVRPGADAKSEADDGDRPSRRLTIPAGFEEALRAREKIKLDLFERKNANPEGTFAAQVAVNRAVIRLLAGEAFGGMEPAQDRIRISSSWAGVRKVPSGLEQAIPGYLVMFVMMSTLIYGSAGLAAERKIGTLARLATTPVSKAEMILGKLAGRALIAILQVAVFIVMGTTFFRISWGGSPAGLVAVLSTLVLCAGALGLLGGTLFKSPDAAAGIGVVISLVMSALGGCWWPLELMPRWLQTAALVFPTTWALNGLHELISWGGGLREVLGATLVLSLIAVTAGGLAVRRLDPAR